MKNRTLHELRGVSRTQHLARGILFSFIVTFVAVRILVILMAEGWFPDVHLRLGATHVHHLSLGIVLLAGVGAALLLIRPGVKGLRAASVLYGIGLALTFDEFGMWLHLEDVYWQRVSFDAVVVIAALLGIVAVGPSLKRVRPRHWTAMLGLGVALGLFLLLVLKPLWSAGRDFGPYLK